MPEFSLEEALGASVPPPAEPKPSSSKEFSLEEAMGQAAPPAAKPKTLSNDLRRQLGLTARYGIEGVSEMLSAPGKAIGQLASGVTGIAGNLTGVPVLNRISRDFNDKYGMSSPDAGSLVADSIGLPKPEGRTERVIGSGSKAMAGGALSIGSVLPATVTKAGTAINGAIGSALEASPTETLGTAAAVAALALGKKAGAGMAENRANAGYRKLFKDNPTASIDAEVITDLGKRRDYINSGNPKNNVALQTKDLNSLADGYISDLQAKLKLSGGNNADVAQVLKDRSNISNIDPDIIKRLQSTPTGQTVLDTVHKANRVDQLTRGSEASSGFSKLARTVIAGGIDAVASAATGIPIFVATPVRAGLNKFLGGASYRWENAEKAASAGNRSASEKYLALNGPSSATEGINVLRDATPVGKAGRVSRANADPKVLDVSSTPLGKTVASAERDTQKAVDESYASRVESPPPDLQSNLSQAGKELPEDTGILGSVNQTRAENNAASTAPNFDVKSRVNQAAPVETPPVLSPLPEDAGILATVQKQRNEMTANEIAPPFNLMSGVTDGSATATAKKAADKAATAAAKKADAKAVKAQTAADDAATTAEITGQHGKDVTGGALGQTYSRMNIEHGLTQAETKQALSSFRDATTSESGKARITKLMNGDKIPDLYATQDSFGQFIKDSGKSKGILSPPSDAPGALSGETTTVRDPIKYAHGVETRKKLYDEGVRIFKESDLPKQVSSDAVGVITQLRQMPSSADRAKAVQELYTKHPEYKTNLNAVFKDFK